MAATAGTDQATLRTSESPKLRPIARLRDLWAYREILVNLIRKELKVKYTQSVLGAAWSMLNPILYLAVFTFVFTVVLPGRLPAFPVYLLSGLIAWNFFSTSLALSARSVVDNQSLVKKVYFPKEILPLAAVGTSLVDFILQTVVLVAFMAIFRYHFLGVNTLLFLLALPALMIVTVAVSMWVAAMNVTYRDTQHLLNLVLLAWFWLTPIVYQSALLQDKLSRHRFLGVNLFHLYFLNPMGDVVLGFQRALYRSTTPLMDGKPSPVLAAMSVGQLALLLTGVIVGGSILLYLCWRLFFHRSGDFAEEL